MYQCALWKCNYNLNGFAFMYGSCVRISEIKTYLPWRVVRLGIWKFKFGTSEFGMLCSMSEWQLMMQS